MLQVGSSSTPMLNKRSRLKAVTLLRSYGGQSDGKWHLSVWGGFQFDPVNSETDREVFGGM